MAYSEDQAAHLSNQQHAVVRELQELFLQIVVQGESATNARVREHLLHGAARRVGVIKRCIENVYTLFPPGASRPLREDKLAATCRGKGTSRSLSSPTALAFPC